MMWRTAGRAAGRQPMVEKRREYARLIRRGSRTRRRVGASGSIARPGTGGRTAAESPATGSPASSSGSSTGSRNRRPHRATWARMSASSSPTVYVPAGRHDRSRPSSVGRHRRWRGRSGANSDVSTGDYRPHAAHQQMLARRPRPKEPRLATEQDLRGLVQEYPDKHWSPEPIARQLRVEDDVPIAVETIYQAIYSPTQVSRRDSRVTFRTKRPPLQDTVKAIGLLPVPAEVTALTGPLVLGGFQWSSLHGGCSDAGEEQLGGVPVEGLARTWLSTSVTEHRRPGLCWRRSVPFGEVVAKQFVGVLVARPLAGTSGVAQEGRHAGGVSDALVVGDCGALVPAEGSAQLFRQVV
jgi:hypothetical protein